MNPDASTELIAQKTGEFERLPGLLLGLDGWILRCVPQELRHQFLRGYEKLLRVTLHPDRCQGAAQKSARESYLQAVSEAVAYMCRDEFCFELASDAVPTRRNPFVQLQNKVDVRDEIISKLNSSLEESQSKVSGLAKALHDVREQLQSVIGRSKEQDEFRLRLRMADNALAKLFPIPLATAHHEATGAFVDVERIAGCESELADQLLMYSRGKFACAESKWFFHGEYIKTFSPFLEKQTKLVFRRTSSRSNDWSIVGAMTVPHLCEFIYSQSPPAQPSSVENVHRALKFLCPESVYFVDDKDAWRIATAPFRVPFYTVGSVLLLQGKKPHKQMAGRVRLFLVLESDYAGNKEEALVKSLRCDLKEAVSEVRARELDYMALNGRMRVVNAELVKQKQLIKLQSKDIKAYEKKFGPVPKDDTK